MNPTLLAPDLVETILSGDDPAGLSLVSLAGSMPMIAFDDSAPASD